MTKKIMLISVIAFFAIITSAFAYQNGMNQNTALNTNYVRGEYHEQIENILETGTYEDLVAFREEVGFEVMRKVQSQEDFESQKERHELREAQGLEPGYKTERGQGQGRGFGMGYGRGNNQRSGNCPMLSTN